MGLTATGGREGMWSCHCARLPSAKSVADSESNSHLACSGLRRSPSIGSLQDPLIKLAERDAICNCPSLTTERTPSKKYHTTSIILSVVLGPHVVPDTSFWSLTGNSVRPTGDGDGDGSIEIRRCCFRRSRRSGLVNSVLKPRTRISMLVTCSASPSNSWS